MRGDVFTAGFSTKGRSNGTGLGMTSLEQIVSAHDWEINIEDGESLEGARFEVTVFEKQDECLRARSRDSSGTRNPLSAFGIVDFESGGRV